MLWTSLERWLPAPHTASRAERLRACAGAAAGLLLTGLISHFALAHDGPALFLVAPMGASAVLLFGLPASPLAQPWSVIGGNVLSGLVGVACVHWLGAGIAVAALAGCLAIAAMFALRCLHPPGGAVALTAVMGGPAVLAAGIDFPLVTVLFNSTLLVATAVLYNNLTGRRYPHTQQPGHPQAGTASPPTVRLGFTPADLDAALRQYNQVLDVSRDDLQALFLQTEQHAYQRRFGIISCADIMAQEQVTVEFGTNLEHAWRALRTHQVGALPVLNRARRVIGIVSRNDFLEHGGLDDYRGMRRQWRHFLRPSGLTHTEKAEVVGQIMRARPTTARLDTPIVDLVPLMADAGLNHIPIVDAEHRYAGMVTQADLVAALYASRLAQAAA